MSVPRSPRCFYHGAFTASDVLNTREALIPYSVGLLGLILVRCWHLALCPAEHPHPGQIALVSLFATQAMNLTSSGTLKTPAWRCRSASPPALMPSCSTAACAS